MRGRASMRRTSRRTSRRVASRQAKKDEANQAPEPAPAAEPAAPSYIAELEKLSELVKSGVINEADYEAKKKSLLGL